MEFIRPRYRHGDRRVFRTRIFNHTECVRIERAKDPSVTVLDTHICTGYQDPSVAISLNPGDSRGW